MAYQFTDRTLEAYTDDPFVETTGSPRTAYIEDETARRRLCRELLSYAQSKLLCQERIKRPRMASTKEAQAAVLDVRIMLSYEASHESTRGHLKNLIASHMRMVYSVSRTREHFQSGYPSEPIFAEAAAKQLHYWRQNAEKGSKDPALEILMDNLRHGLLSQEEVGETTGRMLLMRARDAAAVDETGNAPTVFFSKAVSVVTFVQHLFSAKIAEAILESCPDNLDTSHANYKTTFRERFKDAVINFTHFAKYGDDSACLDHSALAAFIRHTAPICHSHQQSVDAAIPVLLTREGTMCPKNMTMILIQFKLRKTVRSRTKYDIKQETVELFPPASSDTDAGQRRPYITLVMELGASRAPSLLAKVPARCEFKVGKQKHQRELEVIQSSVSEIQAPTQRKTTRPSSKIVIGNFRGRSSSHTTNETHPRYNFTVYGCSPTVYGVIAEHETGWYKALIRSSDLLGDHPRQDLDSLKAVRNLKPLLSIGEDSYHWIKDAVLKPPTSRDQPEAAGLGEDTREQTVSEEEQGTDETDDETDDEEYGEDFTMSVDYEAGGDCGCLVRAGAVDEFELEPAET